jgi:hypothetical protein
MRALLSCITVLLPVMFSCNYSSKLPVTFTVESKEFTTVNVLYPDSLGITNTEDLVLLRGAERTAVDFQLSESEPEKLFFLSGIHQVGATAEMSYELVKGKNPAPGSNRMRITLEQGRYILMKDSLAVLQYNAAMVYPPAGIDEVFKRSGFIHPLYAPSGEVLTNIQPSDHLHHYGLWNPWTKTTFKGEEVDFWNLGKKQGTVRHTSVAHTSGGPVFAEMEFLHRHIAWPESERETLAMSERHIIRSYAVDENIFIIDFVFIITPNDSITLEEYRYGGFVFRGADSWNNKTSTFFTSEDMNRDQADGQRARWCVVMGETPEAGILFMGHPSNFNHPEPLRVWPSDANNGKGDVFINFSPTRNTSWTLEPGNQYRLQYRLVVFNGMMDAATAEILWREYK